MSASFGFVSFYGAILKVAHSADAQARVLWQYRQAARLLALLTGHTDELDSLEPVTWEVFAERYPTTAVGDQLDVLGRIVGVGRDDMTDDEYRPLILTKIRANRSNGTIPDLDDILEVAGLLAWQVSQYQTEVIVEITGVDPAVFELVLSWWKPAGVTLRTLLSADPVYDDLTAYVFRFGALGGARQANGDSGWGATKANPMVIGGMWPKGKVS